MQASVIFCPSTRLALGIPSPTCTKLNPTKFGLPGLLHRSAVGAGCSTGGRPQNVCSNVDNLGPSIDAAAGCRSAQNLSYGMQSMLLPDQCSLFRCSSRYLRAMTSLVRAVAAATVLEVSLSLRNYSCADVTVVLLLPGTSDLSMEDLDFRLGFVGHAANMHRKTDRRKL